MPTISLNTTITVNRGTKDYLPVSYTLNTTGSGYQAGSQTITTSSWQALYTGSASDVIFAYFKNADTGSAVVTIATDNAGTKPVVILAAQQSVPLPWSGSVQFYAEAQNNQAELQYVLVQS